MTPYLTADDPGDERESNPPRPKVRVCAMCGGNGKFFYQGRTNACPWCGGSGSVTR